MMLLTVYLLAGFLLIVLSLFLFWLLFFRGNYRTATPALAYHHVEKHFDFPATKITERQFETQMFNLKAREFRAVTPDLFLKTKGNAGDRTVLITFDDTYESVYRNALPILASAQYTAALFVIAGFIGKKSTWDVSLSHPTHMTEEELRKALSLGCTLGSHTLTHPDLTQLTDARLKEELTASRKLLEDTFQVPVKVLAYPFGRNNPRVRDAVRSAGYDGAFTINRPMLQKRFDPYAVPVTGIYGLDSITNFESKLKQNGCFWIEAMRDKIINRFASGTTLVKGASRA